MATEGPMAKVTVTAVNDFRVAGALHKVVDADGDFSAAGGATALGLAKSQPNSGEWLALGVSGIMKAYAGGALTIGARLTVAASGFVTAAGSGDAIVGTAMQACDSGDIFRGNFNFATRAMQA
jgi:hypothetical protein